MNEQQFAHIVRRGLDESASQLDRSVLLKLEKARKIAVARRKISGASWLAQWVPALSGGSESVRSDQSSVWWGRAGFILPTVALAAGLILLQSWQAQEQIAEIASIDTEVLTDDLPLNAYLDNGFARYAQQGE
jgi:hypothetical protein